MMIFFLLQVSMHGIRIHAPTHAIYTHTTLPLHATALHSYEQEPHVDQSPYVFGGLPADASLAFEWSISADENTALLTSVWQPVSNSLILLEIYFNTNVKSYSMR